MNLYGFAGGDPVNFSDPLGLCGESIKKDEVKEKCRDATAAEGRANLAAAKGRMTSHQKNGIKYPANLTRPGPNEEDCSHFCSASGRAGGLGHIPYHQTAALAGSKYYRAVSASETQPGDIMWQPGHMGIYTGNSDARGRPIGVQMGGGGAREAPFGPNGWFAGGDKLIYYRPLFPKN